MVIPLKRIADDDPFWYSKRAAPTETASIFMLKVLPPVLLLMTLNLLLSSGDILNLFSPDSRI